MKKVCFILTAICFTLLSHAQNLPKTLFWKISKTGNEHVSYIFGTFHEVNPSFFDSLTNVVAKLRQSEILFIEQRSSVSNTASNQKQPYWNKTRWDAILTAEQKKIFTDFVKKAEDTSYYHYTPLLLTLTTFRLFSTSFCQSDHPTTELMDPHIEKIAEKEGKKISSLDVNQGKLLQNEADKFSSSQDSLYASFSTHYMQSMLNDDLSDCEILTAYKNFDINYELETDLSKNQASFLLINRNTKWIKKLQEPLSNSNCFIAVGFRHLFYKEGLIQQLRNSGYTVTPVLIEK